MSRQLAVIAGVGPGLGASLAKRFAAEYDVVLFSRSLESSKEAVRVVEAAGAKAHAYAVDVTDAQAVTNAFGKVAATGTLAAAVFNAGGGFKRGPFLDMTVEDFQNAINVNLLGAVNFSQSALKILQHSSGSKYPPSLLFTGATASVSSRSGSAPFATAKFALRALAFSLAKEFGPHGVHVGHVIVDGVIDTPKAKNYPGFDKPDSKMSPDGMADTYFYLHTQGRSSWAFEVDLRPYVEKW